MGSPAVIPHEGPPGAAGGDPMGGGTITPDSVTRDAAGQPVALSGA